MTIYNHLAVDIALWRRYADFNLRMCDGFWSPEIVQKPYGTIKFGETGDWGDLLWTLNDKPGWTPAAIVTDVEKESERNLKQPGFYINAMYDQPIIDPLRRELNGRDYHKRYDIHWLTLNRLPEQPPFVPDHLLLTDAQTADPFVTVLREAFPDQAIKEDTYRRNIPQPKSAVNVRFVTLADKVSQEPIAIGGMAWDGTLGNLFTLGVREKFRGQGFGRLMLDWRLHELYKQGVTDIVTGVLVDNIKSYNLQKQKGYRHFATAECWLRK